MKNFALLALTLMLVACGTTGPVDLTKMAEPIPANKARVVITRDNSLLYLAAAVEVRLNGVRIASLGRGGSVMQDVTKGQNTLSVSTPTAPGQFVVTFKANPKKVYDFEVSPRAGNILGGYGLGIAGDAAHASVSEQSGYFQIDLKNIK